MVLPCADIYSIFPPRSGLDGDGDADAHCMHDHDLIKEHFFSDNDIKSIYRYQYTALYLG
jgi:hypothetical protein